MFAGRSMRMLAVLCAMAGLLMATEGRADIVIRQYAKDAASKRPPVRFISIEGEIRAGDAARLAGELETLTTPVSLNSGGGSVDEAMLLGAVLRRAGRDAIVFWDSQCASACVLVLAGSPARYVEGPVIIHRPFLPQDTVTDPAQQRERYEKLAVRVKAYLRDMGVNPSLYEDMLRVPSHSARTLNESELQSYGLSGVDPFVEEARLTESARALGISKQEYLARLQKKKTVCTPLVQKDTRAYVDCALSIEYGIDLAEIARRRGVAKTACASAPDPIGYQACELRVILGKR